MIRLVGFCPPLIRDRSSAAQYAADGVGFRQVSEHEIRIKCAQLVDLVRTGGDEDTTDTVRARGYEISWRCI
jgi:hypothetical protein